MPIEERTARADRCLQHPGTPSVATCDGCGRGLCLSCAVPVRGLVLGSECLPQVLGEDAPTGEPVVVRRLGVAGIAFIVATVATLVRWTTLGDGSGPFGAWSASPRWSLLAAIAAVVGAILQVASSRLPIGARTRSLSGVLLGLAVAVGSVLAYFRPPFPTDSALTPWVAACAGAVAAVVSAVGLRRQARLRS